MFSAHRRFTEAIQRWWASQVHGIESLPTEVEPGEDEPSRRRHTREKVFDLRRDLAASLPEALEKYGLLDPQQLRGGFAKWWDTVEADLLSIASSGWSAELIPDEELIQSEFPEVLVQLDEIAARLAELDGLFAAAAEEDAEVDEESGVLPKSLETELKTALKAIKGELKQQRKNNREIWKNGSAADLAAGEEKATRLENKVSELESKLSAHKELEEERKNLRAKRKGTEEKMDELVAAARAKISRENAKDLILARLNRLLVGTYEGYLQRELRAVIGRVENLWDKYSVTMGEIETRGERATARLKGFLETLAYE